MHGDVNADVLILSAQSAREMTDESTKAFLEEARRRGEKEIGKIAAKIYGATRRGLGRVDVCVRPRRNVFIDAHVGEFVTRILIEKDYTVRSDNGIFTIEW